MREIVLADEAATQGIAQILAAGVDGGLVVYLHGDLGAGKTTFARAFLQALGVGERVKSPTYSLVESYDLPGQVAWHLDLYRIADPGELEWLGLDALSDEASLVLVEWPERGADALPAADVHLRLAHQGGGRRLRVESATKRGNRFLEGIK
ncbi:tRNA (adenosine(37)-N6)-threonylcarbamoyltransferase complex ATPase subunit type 1 TsaE [Pinirhizobacter sp.]|uniref:tRNA (adenosine(37)-N6)-threonylcarbamoyltransferase complex ATPase subunit type 1 TsaE n=1 Tax=Pinirhizobacter sp. TaxID=2950432 RepID=UPI002F42BDFC